MSSNALESSALLAAQYLRKTQQQLSTLQDQMSSGLAVASPSDNPSVWAQASQVNSQVNLINAMNSNLNFTASITDAASTGLTNVITALEKIQTDLISAQSSSSNITSAENDILSQQQGLITAITSSSFSGINLLDGSTSNPSYTTSFTKNAAGNYVFSTTTISTADTILTSPTSAGGLLGASTGASTASGTGGSSNGAGGNYDATSILGFSLSSNTSGADMSTLQTAVATAISNVTTGATAVGAVKASTTNQSTFASNLATSLTNGASSLVDADMSSVATRVQALQTQEQLAIQALSIANQTSAYILRLFGI